jgi:glycosyltransferase involved in cell wall biosynthesis
VARKILFVGNFAMWHKATLGYRSLPMARELRAAGHDARLLVPPWDAPTEASSRLTSAWDVPVRYVPVGPNHARNALAVVEAALGERPDVIVAVKPKAYAGLLALLLAVLGRRGGRPIRLVVDTDDWEGTGGWNEMTDAPALAKLAVAWHEQAVLKLADHVIVASRALETLALGSGVPPTRISYLPNASWPGAVAWPPGDRRLVRRELGLSGAPTLLLYSRLFEFDLDRVIRVLGRIARRVPGVRLLVVGAGLHGEERRLAAALEAAGLLGRAILLGWVPRDRLPATLRAGDVALVPLDDTLVNRCRCSVKLLDLMLAGRAIVAERVGQVPEYLPRNRLGRVVAHGDEDALVDAAIDLLRDTDEAERLGRNAAAAARREHTWERQRPALLEAVLGAAS